MCCCRVCRIPYRLQEETSGLTALRATAESAMALHDELAAVYEERLQQDQRLHDELLRWDWRLETTPACLAVRHCMARCARPDGAYLLRTSVDGCRSCM